MTEIRDNSSVVIYTVGHSTRSLPDFVALLKAYHIARLVDIRTVPKSKRHPHYNTEALAQSLPEEGIEYIHMGGLGGFRKPAPDSPNAGWRNAGFRGYADYMMTPEFETELKRIMALAQEKTTAMMCAEAVPWRCHRSVLSDGLTVHGVRVEDIISMTSHPVHHVTPWAHVAGMTITYPTPLKLTL